MPGWNGGEECGILQVSGCAELPVKVPSSERDSAKVPFCLLWVNRARETFIIDRVYIIFCFLFALLFFQLRRSVSRPSSCLVLGSYWTLYRPFGPSSVSLMPTVVNRFFIAVFASLAALLRIFKLPHAFILQWNCRGIKPNYQDLQTVIRQRNPFILCLQETKLAPAMTCSIKGYAVFRKDVHSDTIAHGGVLLAVHHSLPARPLLLNSPLQATAVRVHLGHREITVCSLYSPQQLLPSTLAGAYFRSVSR